MMKAFSLPTLSSTKKEDEDSKEPEEKAPSVDPPVAAVAAVAAAKKEDPAQEIAGFLLSLKHSRSVSPENEVAPTPPVMPGVPFQAYPYPPMMMMPMQVGLPPPTAMAAAAAAAANAGAAAVDAAGKPLGGAAGGKPKKSRAAPKLKMPPLMAPPNFPEFKNAYPELIKDSELVLIKDRDLVPDSLFVAMSQMKVCNLTHADRVGCYKNREIGFIGMCCMHCGGQPGFGRYFPNSVRSLAQTTTSQTILKHVASKCRFCPPDIRAAVVDLQNQQAIREGMASGRPRYGSRKIFFQRIWGRLHGKNKPYMPVATTTTTTATTTTTTTASPLLASAAATAAAAAATAATAPPTAASNSVEAAAAAVAASAVVVETGEKSDDTASLAEEQQLDEAAAAAAAAAAGGDATGGSKRKNRFGALPIMGNTANASKRTKASPTTSAAAAAAAAAMSAEATIAAAVASATNTQAV